MWVEKQAQGTSVSIHSKYGRVGELPQNSTGLEIKKHSSWPLSWDQIAQNSKESIEIVEELCNLEQVTQVLWNLLSLSVKMNGLFYDLLVVSYFSLLHIIFLTCIVSYHSFYIIIRTLKAGHHLPSFPFYIFICSSHQHFRITTSHTEPTYHSPSETCSSLH